MEVMFRLQCFEGETKWCPFQDDIFKLIFLYGIVLLFFFKFDFSAFLNFHTEIYCIILSSCTVRGSNRRRAQDDVITWKRFPLCWSNVRAIGHRGFPVQRASDIKMYLPAFNPFCPVPFAHIRQKTNPYPITC